MKVFIEEVQITSYSEKIIKNILQKLLTNTVT